MQRQRSGGGGGGGGGRGCVGAPEGGAEGGVLPGQAVGEAPLGVRAGAKGGNERPEDGEGAVVAARLLARAATRQVDERAASIVCLRIPDTN